MNYFTYFCVYAATLVEVRVQLAEVSLSFHHVCSESSCHQAWLVAGTFLYLLSHLVGPPMNYCSDFFLSGYFSNPDLPSELEAFCLLYVKNCTW